MNEDLKQMDYNGLILIHLSRLSYVSTSNFIEMVNPAMANQYENPPTSGETAIDWGVNFLYAIIPDTLRDDDFKKENEELNKQPGNIRHSPTNNFKRLRIMINLLHRKGLLIQDKQIGGFSKKPKNKDELPLREEWEE
jgi:hypothetical protein